MGKKLNTFLFNKERPWFPFLLVFIITSVILFFVGFILKDQFKGLGIGIYTESIGMLLDIFVLGIIWSIFEYNRNKKLEIKSNIDIIDDFRDWKSDEAKHRIVGCVRRLQKVNYPNIDLSSCYLVGVQFYSDFHIYGSAAYANFTCAKLGGVDFRKSSLSGAKFIGADVNQVDFRHCDLQSATFLGANLNSADFRGCRNLDKVYFQGALFIEKAIFDNDVNIKNLKCQSQPYTPFETINQWDKSLIICKYFKVGVYKS